MTFCAFESRNNEFAHLVVHSAILHSIRFHSSWLESGLEFVGTQDWFPFIHSFIAARYISGIYRVIVADSRASGIGNGRLACWTSENLEVEINIRTQVCAPSCPSFILGTKTRGKKCGGFVPFLSLSLCPSLSVCLSFSSSGDGAQLPIDLYVFVRHTVYVQCVQLAWISLLTDVSSSFGAFSRSRSEFSPVRE